MIRAVARGQFALTSNGEPGRILVFDSTGKYVESFGHLGRGPGEFQSPLFIFSSADTTTVFDAVQRRLTILLKGRVIKTVPLPFAPYDVAAVGQGMYVFAAMERSPELLGLPLHLFDVRTERLVRSFGAVTERVMPGQFISLARVITPSSDAGVWSAHFSSYTIEKWRVAGDVVSRFERRVAWFKPWDRPPGRPARVERPPANIVDLAEDSNRHLRVIVRMADADWKPMPPARVINGMTLTSDEQEIKLFDSVVEVINPLSGAVIASHRFSEHFLGFINHELVYTYGEDNAGNPYYDIWRLDITLPRPIREDP